MNTLLFELSAAPGLANTMRHHLGYERGELERRQFPDGESYVRIITPVQGRDVVLLCTLDRPDAKYLPLLFAAAAARAQGARSVGLVAPYLAYLRQDKSFQPGEAVTSVAFADTLSKQVDWIVTIDPHLHRYSTLAEIYSIPTISASAADAISQWVQREVVQPILIGPDAESRQWVMKIGGLVPAPIAVLEKQRRGDFSVSIEETAIDAIGSGTPVIVDDIASSARTMIETIELLKRHERAPPVCVVVHPIFAGDAYESLQRADPARVVSTNSISHQSNAIDISETLAEAVRKVVADRRS